MKAKFFTRSSVILSYCAAAALPLAVFRSISFSRAQEPKAESGELPRIMDQATVHAKQATEAMKLGKWAVARDQWQLLLKVVPDSAAAHANLGAVLLQLKEPEEARIHLEKATSLRPTLANAWMSLGMVHSDAGRTMLAISCLTRAVAEDQNDSRLRNALAITLKKAGWLKGAEMEFQRAVDMDPTNPDAHFNLALLYMDLKPPAEESARRHYTRAKALGAAPDVELEKLLNPPNEPPTPPPVAPPAKAKK